jgi:hypothetical protein
MKEQLIIFLRKKANLVETIKITLLIAGIITGIIRDIQAPADNNLFQLHKKYQNESNIPQFNSSITTLHLKNDFLA